MKQSAGILLYRHYNSILQVFLVHPGGPFWKNKDLGSWSIPKGEFTNDEAPLDAAIREFEEETGSKISGDFFALEPIKLKSGKVIYAWAVEGDIDAATIKSNNFEMEWPPKRGITKSFPEVDKAEWVSIKDGMQKINEAQAAFISQLIRILKTN